jgi:glycosyltransferase involved in cell wall biosynthesis
MTPQVIFVQNSVHLAGAQKSLSRLLAAPGMQPCKPVLLTGQEGWLTRHCEAAGVPWVRVPFPSSRSLGARLWGNRRFARQAAAALLPLLDRSRPCIIHANDHPDSLLALQLTRRLQSASVLTLRTPGMSRADFDKYRCGRHRHLIAVGEDLHAKVSPWAEGLPLSLVHNGVRDDEILPPVENTGRVETVLALGSIIPRKGWQDLVEALLLLESRLPPGPLPEVHFLGDLLGRDPAQVLGTGRLRRFKAVFLGVAEDYQATLRRYALAVHPSRDESFGMAALECVAAGVPLIAARTGLIPRFIPQAGLFSVPPQGPAALAACLESCLQMQAGELRQAFDFPAAHSEVRAHFSTSGTVARLRQIYETLAAPA